MTRTIAAVVVAALVAACGGPARAADDKDTQAILDKAMQALGGKDKLSKIHAGSWKSDGIIIIGGNDNKFSSQTTVQGLNQFRQEFKGEFGGNEVKGVTVVNGDKGWRKFGDMEMEMDADALANQKRNIYLTVIPMVLTPLTGAAFKVEPADTTKVGDKPAVGIKVTPPDGKEFTLYFDKESGLPVKQVAKVVGFNGDEFTQETTYSDYKEMDGIKKATKVESKRNGEKFIEQKLTEFKILEKVPPKTFAKPE
jgi:hypothetical protein